MAKDLGEMVRDAVGQVAKEAVGSIGDSGSKKKSGSPLSGVKGVAVGAGLAGLAPLAVKGAKPVKRLLSANGGGIKDAADSAGSKAGEGVGKKLKESVNEKVEDAGGVGGVVKEAAGGVLPGGGGDGAGGKGSVPGVGKGRRMPVQQAIDVAVPIETAYNQWTQFEEWPSFMFRLANCSQEDDCTVAFSVKLWGFTREFTAEIETQRPDERIKWSVKQGVTHTGVVTFHELGPRLTRIEVNVDVDPGSLIEKAGRGMRHTKRVIRSDLHRFKAFIEMKEIETGAWRGVIEDGELVQEHPEEYDEERDYSDAKHSLHEDDDSDKDDDSDEDEEQPEASEEEEEGDGEDAEEEGAERTRSERFQRQLRTSSGGGRRSGNGSSSNPDDSPSRPSRPRKPAGRR
jgi:uncharacterized membrane protein